MASRNKRRRVSPGEHIKNALEEDDQHRFEIRFISSYKGWGVFAKEEIMHGDFLFIYRGEWISAEEGERRLCSIGPSFLFFVGKNDCVDASYTEGLGRMINDSVKPRYANAVMKIVNVGVRKYLCLFASRNLSVDEEIVYYYGPTDENMYWRLGKEPSVLYNAGHTVVPVNDDEQQVLDPIVEPHECERESVLDPVVDPQECDRESISGHTVVPVNDDKQQVLDPMVEPQECERESVLDPMVEPQECERESISGHIVVPVNDDKQQVLDPMVEPQECERESVLDPMVDPQECERESISGHTVVPVNDDKQQVLDPVVEPQECERESVRDPMVEPQECERESISGHTVVPVNDDKQQVLDPMVEPQECERESVRDPVVEPQECERESVRDPVAEPQECERESVLDPVVEPQECERESVLDPVVEPQECERESVLNPVVEPQECERESVLNPVVEPQECERESISAFEKYCMTKESRYCNSASTIVVFHKKAAYEHTLQTYPDLMYENFVPENYGWQLDTGDTVVPVNDDKQQVLDPMVEPQECERESVLDPVVEPQECERESISGHTVVPVNDDEQQVLDPMMDPQECERESVLDPVVEPQECERESVLDPVVEPQECERESISGHTVVPVNDDKQQVLDPVVEPQECERESVLDPMMDPQECERESISDFLDMIDGSDDEGSEIVPYYPMLRVHNVLETNEEDFDDDRCDPDYHAEDSSESDESSSDSDIEEKGIHLPVTCEVQCNYVSSSLSKDTNRTSKDTNRPIVSVEKRRSNLEKGQRDWKRKHACFMCQAKVCDIPRHVSTKHKDNDLVKEAIAMPKGSKERRTFWRIITNKGAFANNQKAKAIGGELQVSRRTTENRKPEEYKACLHCYGYFLKKELWRHSRTCSASVFGNKVKNCVQSNITSLSSVLDSASSCTSSHVLRENFYETMKLKDEVFTIVKNDKLLQLYTAALLEEGKSNTDVSWTVRLLGKLLLKARELSAKESLPWLDLIEHTNWNLLAEGIRALAKFKYTEDGLEVESPNIGIKCGQGVRGLIAAAEGYALQLDDDIQLTKTKKMFLNFDREWPKLRNACRQSLKTKAEDRENLLPLTEDITKLKEYCVEQIWSISRQMQSKCDTVDYKCLALFVLARLITFNARRGGEPGKLKVAQWEKICDGKGVHKEEIEALQEEEKLLAKRLKLGYVPGKGKKKVPMIFPEETVYAINIMLKYRNTVISNQKNPYIFGRLSKNSMKKMRGSDAVRYVCDKACLKNSSLITATQVRKYLSTTLQLIDMTDSELRWVTDHMGHTLDVHKRWYRMSNNTVELSKVASVLLAAEAGSLQKAFSVPFDNVLSTVSSDGNVGKEKVEIEEEKMTRLEEAPATYRMGTESGDETSDEDASIELSRPVCPETKKSKKQVHKPWSLEEKKALFDAFGPYLETSIKKLPGKSEITKAQLDYKILSSRTWLNIKYQLKNMKK